MSLMPPFVSRPTFERLIDTGAIFLTASKLEETTAKRQDLAQLKAQQRKYAAEIQSMDGKIKTLTSRIEKVCTHWCPCCRSEVSCDLADKSTRTEVVHMARKDISRRGRQRVNELTRSKLPVTHTGRSKYELPSAADQCAA